MIDWNAELATVANLMTVWQRVPVIPTWSRLEPLPLTRGDLTPGTQALLGDPLWLVGRQWQFDELRGEDAGSPIHSTLSGVSAPFSRVRPGTEGEPQDLPAIDADGAPPLEAIVEAETPTVWPLRLRIQAGLHLQRLLRRRGLAAAATAAAVAFTPAPGNRDGEPDPAGDRRRRLAARRVPDAAAVLEALAALDDGAGGLTGVPPELAGAGDATAVMDVLLAWRSWFEDFVVGGRLTAWDPANLEHQFALQAATGGDDVVLEVGEYRGGTLDWYHGELRDDISLGPPATEPGVTAVRDEALPTPLRYAGMPSDRLFGFEDAAVYLGGVEAGRTDLARMALVEFAIAYGVDWFVVPLVLRHGTVTRLDDLVVRDTFGVEVHVKPSRETSRPGWAAFQSVPPTTRTSLGDMFVLAPTVHALEGDPLEEVALFRDEMANLVWGVERTVADASSGEPIDRTAYAPRVSLRQAEPEDLGDAQIVYRLMSPVPENWLPFVAVPAGPGGGGHVLERRPFLRFDEDGQPRVVSPRGTVLLTDLGADPASDRLRIAEEQVPREGVVVTRSFQLARTEGGGSALWIGRRAQVGRGEGASGLQFDTALPPGSA